MPDRDVESAKSLLSSPQADDDLAGFPPRSLWGEGGLRGRWRRAGSVMGCLPPWMHTVLLGLPVLLMGWALGRSSVKRMPVVLTVSPNPVTTYDFSEFRANPYDPLPSSLANVRTLNYQQCDDAFPLLWPEVRNTARMFQQRPRDGITIEDLDEVEQGDGTRVSVVDGQLYVKRWNGEWTKRSEAVLASLHEAIVTSPDPFPNVEFWATDNIGYGAHFGLTKEAGSPLWLLPDFGFFSWPEPRVLGWQDARRKAIEVESTLNFTDKEPKLFWRGVSSLGSLRNLLREAAEGKEWNDVGEIDWATGAGRIPMEEHCRKQFLASADSHSYSGRLKYLLLCRSVVVTHRKRWKQHFHGALDGREGSPTQNWVELEHENWDGLDETMERLLKDREWAARVAENAQRSMRDRYLTPASVACYWRRVLAEYAALQRFTPTPGGIDYESFILVREIDYPPH